MNGECHGWLITLSTFKRKANMISYRKDPMAAAPESQLHYCVQCMDLFFQSLRKRTRHVNIFTVMMFWLLWLLDYKSRKRKSRKRKGKEEKEDSCLGIKKQALLVSIVNSWEGLHLQNNPLIEYQNERPGEGYQRYYHFTQLDLLS